MIRRILLGAAFALTFLAGGWILGPRWGREPTAYRQARIFDEVVSTIHDEFVDPVDAGGLYVDAARQAVESLHDPFAELLIGDQYRDYDNQLTGTEMESGALVQPETPPPGAVHVSATSRAALTDHGIGYVALNAMTQGSALELRRTVDSLRARGMTKLVLDLRMNPGGLIQEGVAVASLFLDPGDTVATIRGRGPEHSRVYQVTEPQRWPTLPLVLLVDHGTASSAELITAALQDHHRAAVVGSHTYGKGIVQTTYRLDPLTAVKLTTARWYAPSGRSIQRAPELDSAGTGGIVPDVRVARGPMTAGDAALLRAVAEQLVRFQEVVERCGAELAASGGATTPDFVVTAAMRERLFQRLAEAGIVTDRAVFDDASGWVDRNLGPAVARAAFGSAAGLRRQAASDRTLATAISLLRRSATPRSLATLALNTGLSALN